MRAENIVASERGRSMFAVETGVEQMVAERKESSNDEGRNHQSWSGPIDLRHRRGQLSLGRSRCVVGKSSV